MISDTVYTIEILLEPRSGARSGLFDLIAVDRSRQRLFEAGVADLDLRGKSALLPNGRALFAVDFCNRFLRGEPVSAEQGLTFGQMLLGLLLADPPVARAWSEMQARRMASDQPMKLLLRLPGAGQSDVGSKLVDAKARPPSPIGGVLDIPFQLLADEHGFLFKDRGHTLVRMVDRSASAGSTVESAALKDLPVTRRAGSAALDKAIAEAGSGAITEGGSGDARSATARSPDRELDWATSVLEAAEPATLIEPIEEAIRAWGQRGSTASSALTGDLSAPLLPQPSPFFRGREEELERALSLLATERLVSIVGMAGIGKTDLAALVAHRALYDSDLQLISARWFTLDGLTEVDALRTRMALALGLDPRRCRTDEHLARVIGGGRALFVLDGAEGLLRDPLTRTRFQWLLNTLLQDCAELRFLVTTRKRIGEVAASGGDTIVANEVAISLGALGAPVDREVFLAASGVRLTLEEHRSAEFGELVKALMGHPRALMLAAAMTGSGVTLRDLREQIEGGDGSLEGGEVAPMDASAAEARPSLAAGAGADEGGAGAESRSSSGAPPSSGAGSSRSSASFEIESRMDEQVRTNRFLRTLNLSLAGLKAKDERAVEMLAWLGHLPSGLPEVLIPYVLGPGAERHGAALLREHLVERRGTDRRIRLAAPLGAFTLRQSEIISDDRHAELLQAALMALGAWLSAPDSQPGLVGAGEDRDRSVQQESNLAALVLSIPEPAPKDREDALAKAVASAIVPFAQQMIRAGRARAASEVCREAVRRILPLGVGTPLAAVLTALGDLFVRVDRLTEAEEAYEQALPLYRALNDHLSEASTLQGLGDVFIRAKRLAEAQYAFEQALILCRALEDRLGEANSLRALGDLYLRTDRLKEAEEAYEKVLPMYRTLAERRGEARTLQALGDLLLRMDRLKETEQAYSRALPLYRTLDEELGEANTLQALGDLYLRTDRLKEAEDAYTQALPLYRSVEESLGEANTLRALGELFLRTDRHKEAEGVFRQALPLYRSVDDKVGQANTLQSMGKLALTRQEGETAFGWFLAALRLHEAAADRLGVGGDRGYLARAARVAGRPLRAAVLGGSAMVSLDGEDGRFGQMLAIRDLARSLAALGEQGGAVAAWFLAWVRARLIGDPSAPSLAAMLVEVLHDFDPSMQPQVDMVTRYERELAEVLASCEARLKEDGEDPYAPLKP